MKLATALTSLNGEIPSELRIALEEIGPETLKRIEVEMFGKCGYAGRNVALISMEGEWCSPQKLLCLGGASSSCPRRCNGRKAFSTVGDGTLWLCPAGGTDGGFVAATADRFTVG